MRKVVGRGDGLGVIAEEEPAFCDEGLIEVLGIGELFGCVRGFFEDGFEELKLFECDFGRARFGFVFGEFFGAGRGFLGLCGRGSRGGGLGVGVGFGGFGFTDFFGGFLGRGFFGLVGFGFVQSDKPVDRSG